MTGTSAVAGLEPGWNVPALPGMTLAEVQTPALVLDLDALERNIRRMGDFVRTRGLRHRAHGKMHKSIDVLRLQERLGGVQGVCCQKVSEAEAFVRAGAQDVLLSNQVRDPAKIDRLARLAARPGTRITLCVDDPANVPELAAAAARHAVVLGVYVELDCGAGRCGLATPEALVDLARMVAATPGLRYDGVQAYQGAMQHLADYSERAAAGAAAHAKVARALAALTAAGLPATTVSGGGTGSYAFDAASGLFTELQCGSYAFMDGDYGRLSDARGSRLDAGDWENALFVLSEVISHVQPGRAVVDAGLKAMTTESGLPHVHRRPGIKTLGISDEHGTLLDAADPLVVGDRLFLVPGHCDPTCNLHDWYVGLRGDRVESIWPVTARGKIW